jgi:hypothetical protein
MGLRPDEVIEFFQFYLILPAALDPEVYPASNSARNRKKNVLGE